MKNLILAIAILFLFSAAQGKDRNKTDKNNKNKTEVKTDSINFFQNEVRESVLEYIKDTGMNPDSCYIPFKDEL
jgi:hypothetical protein